jgi:hypothetical protein
MIQLQNVTAQNINVIKGGRGRLSEIFGSKASSAPPSPPGPVSQSHWHIQSYEVNFVGVTALGVFKKENFEFVHL